jgi:hypothetical protein
LERFVAVKVSAIPYSGQVIFVMIDDGVCCLFDQHEELDFKRATRSILKQQSAGRQVAPFGHIAYRKDVW